MVDGSGVGNRRWRFSFSVQIKSSQSCDGKPLPSGEPFGGLCKASWWSQSSSQQTRSLRRSSTVVTGTHLICACSREIKARLAQGDGATPSAAIRVVLLCRTYGAGRQWPCCRRCNRGRQSHALFCRHGLHLEMAFAARLVVTIKNGGSGGRGRRNVRAVPSPFPTQALLWTRTPLKLRLPRNCWQARFYGDCTGVV